MLKIIYRRKILIGISVIVFLGLSQIVTAERSEEGIHNVAKNLGKQAASHGSTDDTVTQVLHNPAAENINPTEVATNQASSSQANENNVGNSNSGHNTPEDSQSPPQTNLSPTVLPDQSDATTSTQDSIVESDKNDSNNDSYQLDDAQTQVNEVSPTQIPSRTHHYNKTQASPKTTHTTTPTPVQPHYKQVTQERTIEYESQPDTKHQQVTHYSNSEKRETKKYEDTHHKKHYQVKSSVDRYAPEPTLQMTPEVQSVTYVVRQEPEPTIAVVYEEPKELPSTGPGAPALISLGAIITALIGRKFFTT